MKKDELMKMAGISVDAAEGRDEDTWALLKRKPDKRDPKTRRIISEGSPLRTRLNVETILARDPRWSRDLRFNDFSGRSELEGEVLEDHKEVRICLDISRLYGLEMTPATIGEVADLQARSNSYHPVRDYLDRCRDRWDGAYRLEGWLSTYLGATATPLKSAYGLRWAIGAVARIYDPGCKLDTVLILVGAQGAKKSTAFRVLGGSYFVDTVFDLRQKDALLALQGAWIYELCELSSIRKRESTAVKAFLSAQIDRFRPPYGRHMRIAPRQCVIVGTTNAQVFLSDSTGSRRFWPVEVGTIDIEALQRDRDQLWGEAVAWYRNGAPWWLNPELERSRSSEAEQRQAGDPWAPLVETALGELSAKGWVTIAEILSGALGKDRDRWNRGDEMRVADILSSSGWIKGRRKWVDKKRVYPWLPPKSETDG